MASVREDDVPMFDLDEVKHHHGQSAASQTSKYDVGQTSPGQGWMFDLDEAAAAAASSLSIGRVSMDSDNPGDR